MQPQVEQQLAYLLVVELLAYVVLLEVSCHSEISLTAELYTIDINLRLRSNGRTQSSWTPRMINMEIVNAQ